MENINYEKILPSLVISITSDCNMKCIYCPTGGENLKIIKEECDTEHLLMLLEAYKEFCGPGVPLIVRLTGGEPLLPKYQSKIECVFDKLSELQYTKIVLGTNGLELGSYLDNKNSNIHKIKESLLLKISLDSLDPNTFSNLTQSKKANVSKVIANIRRASQLGFNIGVNSVLTKYNVEDLPQLIDFCENANLDELKILSLNNFGDELSQDFINNIAPLKEIRNKLLKVIDNLKSDKTFIEKNLFLNGDKGIEMKTFTKNNTTYKIVDHNPDENSITQTRTFCEKCLDCEFYPDNVKEGMAMCSTGIMTLSLRADGVLSFCRIKPEKGSNINNKNYNETLEIIKNQANNFQRTFKK